MARTRIKICGIRTYDDAMAAAIAGADAVGFNFVRGSARFIEPTEAWKIVSNLPPLVSSVGVFANASLDTFSDIEEICPTAYSQLSGSENETLVRECGPNVIKAVRYDAATVEKELARWDRLDEVDAILLELPVLLPAGEELAALVAATRSLDKPLFLGGHLTPENVSDLVHTFRPWAVDLTAGVEREPGVKDPALLESMCRAVQTA
jgi:phosphoribosylanthranilate isomerase